jgi:hypothetical protein
MLPSFLVPTELSRHKLITIVIYVSTSILACLLIETTKLSVSSHSLIASHGVTLEATSTEFNGKSLIDIGADPRDPIRMFHTDLSLCDGKPDNFTIPKNTDEPVAILLPENGKCPIELIANNVVNWYQADNPMVKYIILYTERLPSKRFSLFRSLEMSIRPTETTRTSIGEKIPLTLFFVSDKTAKKFIKNVSESGDTGSLTITFKTTSFQDKTLKEKITIYSKDFATSLLITTISLFVTLSLLVRFWGASYSIEFSWRGADIMYLAPDAPPDPKKLLSEEQVLSLPETKYAGDEADEENALPTNSTCPICIDDFEKDEVLRVLPCGHLHHTECIMPWLTTRQANCPVCKESFCEEIDKKDS